MATEDQIADFLVAAGWQASTRSPLAGDASTRRYERLTDATRGDAVLMPAAPGSHAPFRLVANWLISAGLSAPKELAADDPRGLLLVEDLGDQLFTLMIGRDQSTEPALLTAACDVLIHLARQEPPPFLKAMPPTYRDLSAMAWDWYAKGLSGGTGNRDAALDGLETGWSDLSQSARVFIHRDWHAGNLLWLADRTGVKRTGIIDFQDALIGHPGYDLVSMTRDARRAVPDALHEALVDRYAAALSLDRAAFGRDCALLAVQRNLRILGIFTRLSLQGGKPQYVDFIPTLWRHLLADLSHPALAHLKAPVLATLPEPTSENLNRLKDLCGTSPTL